MASESKAYGSGSRGVLSSPSASSSGGGTATSSSQGGGTAPSGSTSAGSSFPAQRFGRARIPPQLLAIVPPAIRRYFNVPLSQPVTTMSGSMTSSDVSHRDQHTMDIGAISSASQDGTITPHGDQPASVIAGSSSVSEDHTITADGDQPQRDQHVLDIGGSSSVPQDNKITDKANLRGLRGVLGLFRSSRQINSGGKNTLSPKNQLDHNTSSSNTRNNSPHATGTNTSCFNTRNNSPHPTGTNVRGIENPDDSASTEMTKDKMQIELKQYRTVSLALIALVCSVGLYGLSSNISISEEQKFFSCVALVVTFLLAILTVSVSFAATTDDWHVDLISVASVLQTIYLFDILLLFLYSFAYWHGAKSDDNVKTIMLVGGGIADLIIFIVWISVWRRPKNLYNAPSMKIVRGVSCALLMVIWCALYFIFCCFFGLLGALICGLYGVLHKLYEVVSQASVCNTRQGESRAS